MNRRAFFLKSAACAVTAATKCSFAPLESNPAWSSHTAVAKKSNLRLGTQHGDSDDILKVLAAFGVNHICALPPELENGGDWSIDALARKREHIESHEQLTLVRGTGPYAIWTSGMGADAAGPVRESRVAGHESPVRLGLDTATTPGR